jgi:hypothetical protein
MALVKCGFVKYGIISERTAKDVGKIGRGLIGGNSLEFAWND